MATEFCESIALIIAERAAAREANWQARQERRAAERVAFKATRDARLIRRYALKAARSQQRPSIT